MLTADAKTETEQRRKIRLDGQHSLADVARKICGDVRLSPLLADLNPTVPSSGALPAGTIVVVPTKTEAAAFAKRMGFSVGFDPQATNGTAARRKWSQHVAPKTTSEEAVDGAALAKSLLERAVSPQEAGKRLAKLCSEDAIGRLLASTDAAVVTVAKHAEAHALYPRAVSKLVAVRSALDATVKPAGLGFLVDALTKSPAAAGALLQGAAVSAALRDALLREAPRIASVIAEAKQLAQLERGARDAAAKDPALKAVVDAVVDGVEPLAGVRLELLGVDAEIEALTNHVAMLRNALKQAEQGLARQSADVIRILARGLDGAKLARPWPLLAAVVRDVGRALDAASTTARDRGLGGLVARASSSEGAPVSARAITVAELRVRAAACAKAADEGDAFAEKLAPAVVELFALMRPPPAVDGGTPQARLQRRRTAFELAMTAKGDVSADGIAAIAADVVERARSAGNAAAARFTRAQLQSLLEASAQVAGPLTLHRHAISELGRALVVAAMALDGVVGQGLARPTGREAFVVAANKHAGKVLSAASCALKP